VGRVNAYYEQGLSPWDLAAGALIASEAGATVASLDGPIVAGGLILAAPRSLFPSFRDLLISAGAGEG
jgi:myo-inositol-1(or 4)-monophosphatase